MADEKACTKCAEAKPLSAFGKMAGSQTKLAGRCRACAKIYQTEWGKRNAKRNLEAEASGHKICKICKTSKDIRQFGRVSASKGGFGPTCLGCLRKKDRARYGRDPGRKLDQAKWGAIKNRFGLSKDQWRALLESQGMACAICHIPFVIGRNRGNMANPCIDHDHKTKIVRGALCKLCNQAIGLFKDDPSVIVRAAIYLRRAR